MLDIKHLASSIKHRFSPMPIQVICPGCHTRFKVGDQHAGKAGACPKCKGPIQIPTAADEVVIHAPESEPGAKDAKGRNIFKPLRRKEAKFQLNTALIIGGATLLTVAIAFLVGRQTMTEGARTAILAVGALLLGPPLAYAGYSFLRNDEMEPFRGKDLLIRSLACGTAYAAMWGLYWYLGAQFFELGESKLELFQIGVLLIPVLLLGAGIAFLSFDFDPLTGFFHFTLYFVATVLLRAVMFLPLMPGMGEVPTDRPAAPQAKSPASTSPAAAEQAPAKAGKGGKSKSKSKGPANPVSAF